MHSKLVYDQFVACVASNSQVKCQLRIWLVCKHFAKAIAGISAVLQKLTIRTYMRPWTDHPIQMARFLYAVLDPRRFISGTQMIRALHSGAICSLTHATNRAVLETLSTSLRAGSPGRHCPPVREEFHQRSCHTLSVRTRSLFGHIYSYITLLAGASQRIKNSSCLRLYIKYWYTNN